MNSLRAVKTIFVSRTPVGPQPLGSNGYGDKVDEDYASNNSETSGDNLEAGFVKPRKFRKPGLGRRFADYAHGRKTSITDWSAAQPRSVWASIISAALGSVIILYVHPPALQMLATHKGKDG